jgi:hypothetical protein
MATFSNNLVAFCGNKNGKEYYCSYCDYKCSKKYNWTKHLTTTKHLEATNSNKLVAKIVGKNIDLKNRCFIRLFF